MDPEFRRLQRKIDKMMGVVSEVNNKRIPQAASEVVESIAIELRQSQPEDQVGFDAAQFLSNLRATLYKDSNNTWQLDPLEAGGDEGDFEAIGGSGNRADHLWHAGTVHTEAFFRRIRFNSSRSAHLAGARQSVWGDLTPQWHLLNYGSPEADQPATFFLENGIASAELDGISVAIADDLEDAWRG